MAAGVWGRIPVPLEQITDHLRLVAVSFDPKGEVADVLGAFNDETRTIFVRGDVPAQRQRFIIAHELGHVMLNKGRSFVDEAATIDAPTDSVEIEASKFAAELLMPESWFRTIWADRRGKLDRVAAYFGVTGSAAHGRAKDLGLSVY